MPVVEEKAGETPRQRRRSDRDAHVLMVNRDQGQRRADKQANARREAVHAVDQVPDVHASKEPKHRDEEAENRPFIVDAEEFERHGGFRELDRPTEDVEALNSHAAGEQDQHRQGLPEQLGSGPESSRVVGVPDHQDDHGGEQDSAFISDPLGKPRPGIEIPAEDDEKPTHEDPKRQSKPAKARRRPLVDSPKVIGPIDRPGPDGNPGHYRGRQHATHEGDRED